MRVVVGMATFQGREMQLEKAYESLIKQVDDIHIYDNSQEPDLTDNGKFYSIIKYSKPTYFFTCDDDLLYSPDYVQRTIEQIERFNCIVTYHGRKLQGLGRNYYTGHKAFRFMDRLDDDLFIDVAGTGVTAFRTDYFFAPDLWKSEDKLMSDLVFSLEATKQGKDIVLLKHEKGFIKDLQAPLETSIHYREWRKCNRQNEIADEIFKLKNKVVY